MNRRHLTFDCGSDTLVGSLDAADAATGLLIVTGGNELRCGPYGAHAELADKIATAGFPVLRFDRRGVGDSGGDNQGFTASADDIAAAIAAFRIALPRLKRIVAYGNCDAASGLMLFAADLGIDALVLANPWTIEGADEAVQVPAALRRRYGAKLADPAEWRRLLSGAIDLRKLAGGLRQAAASAPQSALADQMRAGLLRFVGPVTILLAERDRTAELFAAAWGADPRIARLPSASHSFADEAAREWLLKRVLHALA